MAVLALAGARTAVAADGVVLGPGLLSSSLPLLDAGRADGAETLPAVGRSVRSGYLLRALTVMGAAPAALARAVTRVYSGTHGSDGRAAQRPARLLRRRNAPARQVAVARARARRPELGRRRLHRRAPAGTPGRGLCARCRPSRHELAPKPNRPASRHRPPPPNWPPAWKRPSRAVSSAGTSTSTSAGAGSEPAPSSSTAPKHGSAGSTQGKRRALPRPNRAPPRTPRRQRRARPGAVDRLSRTSRGQRPVTLDLNLEVDG